MKRFPFVILLLAAAALLLAGCRAGRAQAASPDAAHYTLEATMADGRMVFMGVGGAIDGVINPDLPVAPGETVALTVVNSGSMAHDIAVPAWNLKSAMVTGKGSEALLEFTVPADAMGRVAYICSVAGHQIAGMEGALVVQ